MSAFRSSLDTVLDFFRELQNGICHSLENEDGGASFTEDSWVHENGGGGRSRVLNGGKVFEKGGVNLSHVRGQRLPESATADRGHLAGKPFEANGVSLVMHPKNPFIPTVHMNVRLFVADLDSEQPVWWFGGGYDLTPYYGFDEDCVHWHQTAREACDPFGASLYPKYKKWCDEYFYLKHRKEPRGIGGLFFDDFSDGGFDHAFGFVRSVGSSFTKAYIPIVQRRREHPYQGQHVEFQQYRRGRYVEFNLVYDRGTIFGLQSGGRTESILMSLPPKVQWRYNWQPNKESDEARLYERYLVATDWLGIEPN